MVEQEGCIDGRRRQRAGNRVIVGPFLFTTERRMAMAKKELTAAEKKAATEKRNAEKRARFLKLAPKRVRRAVKVIAGVGKTSGSGYVFTPEEAKSITAALHAAVEKVKLQFEGKRETVGEFELPK